MRWTHGRGKGINHGSYTQSGSRPFHRRGGGTIESRPTAQSAGEKQISRRNKKTRKNLPIMSGKRVRRGIARKKKRGSCVSVRLCVCFFFFFRFVRTGSTRAVTEISTRLSRVMFSAVNDTVTSAAQHTRRQNNRDSTQREGPAGSNGGGRGGRRWGKAGEETFLKENVTVNMIPSKLQTPPATAH